MGHQGPLVVVGVVAHEVDASGGAEEAVRSRVADDVDEALHHRSLARALYRTRHPRPPDPSGAWMGRSCTAQMPCQTTMSRTPGSSARRSSGSEVTIC